MMRGRLEMWVGYPPLLGTGRWIFEPAEANATKTHRLFFLARILSDNQTEG